MTDTCNLQGLKGSTRYQISRSDSDPVLGAYVLTVQSFQNVDEKWKKDEFHLYMSEIVYIHPEGKLCLIREFQKWDNFDSLHKPVILLVKDTPLEQNPYTRVIVERVEVISDEFPDMDSSAKYEILHKDAECRIYTITRDVDDPNYELGVLSTTEVFFEFVPYPEIPNVVEPKIPVPL